MAEIDNLSIQISAECSKAVTNINKLSASLGTLSTKLSTTGSNSKSIGQLSSSLRNLSSAMTSMKGIDGRQFSSLARNISKLYSIDGSRLLSVGQGIQHISSSLQSLSGGTNAIAQIGQLATSLNMLGRAKATTGITNLQPLTQGLTNMMNALNKAPQVSDKTIRLINALANLSAQGQKVGSAAKGIKNFYNTTANTQKPISGISRLISSLKSLTSSANRIKSTGNGISAMIGKFFATYWIAIRIFSYFRKAIDVASDLTEVQNVVANTFGNMTDKVNEFSKSAINKLGMSELKAKEVSSTFQAMAKNMNISSDALLKATTYTNKVTNGYAEVSKSVGDLSLSLTTLTGDMASFYNKSQDVIAQDLQSIFTGQTKPLRKYGIDLTEANLKQWALTQGINANIKAMTQAEKTLLRYQYVMAHTRTAQGDFERTANSWHNQVVILKANIQQLANVIGQGLIQALKPLVSWLNKALLSLTNFATTVLNALGVIFGWKYEDFGGAVIEDETDAMEDFSDATDNAANSVKKLKGQLQGFDKLNNLTTTDKNSGSGGSGSTSGVTGGSDGAWTRTEGAIEKFKSSITDLESLGIAIANSLKNAMDNIDWDSVYAKAKGFGSGLAKFLNGLFSTDKKGNNVFKSLGKTIAGSLNTLVYSVFSFSTEFKWDDFGKAFSSGINSFFDTFDFKMAGETIGSLAEGLTTFLLRASEDIHFDEIGTKIGEGLKGIFDKMGEKKWVNVDGEWKNLTGWQRLGLALSKFTDGMFTALGKAIEIIPWEEIGKAIVGFICAIDWENKAWDLTKLGDALGKAFMDTELGVVEKPEKKKWEKLSEWLGIDFDFDEMWKQFKEDLEDAYDRWSPLAIIERIFSGDWFNENGYDNTKSFVDTIKQFLFGNGSTSIDEDDYDLSLKLKVSVDNIKDKIKEKWDSAKEWWGDKKLEISVGIQNIKDKIKEKWDSAKEWWNEKKAKLNEVTPSIADIKQKLSDKWTTAKEWWNTKKAKLNEICPTIADIKKKISEKWDKVKEWANKNMKLRFKVEYTTPTKGLQQTIVSLAKLKGWPTFKFYKNGGFPDTSDIFFANENGVPELVGTMGGKPAVASGNEITGIKDAIYETGQQELQLLRQQNILLNQLLAKEFGISSNDIFNSVRRSDQQYSNMNGHSAFAY